MIQKYTSDCTIVQMCYDIAARSWHIRAIQNLLNSTATSNTISTGSLRTHCIFLKPFLVSIALLELEHLLQTCFALLLPTKAHFHNLYVQNKWRNSFLSSFLQGHYTPKNCKGTERIECVFSVPAMVLNIFPSTAIQRNAAHLHIGAEHRQCVHELKTGISRFFSHHNAWTTLPPFLDYYYFFSLHTFGLSDRDLDIFMPLLGKKWKKKKAGKKKNYPTKFHHCSSACNTSTCRTTCRYSVKSLVP